MVFNIYFQLIINYNKKKYYHSLHMFCFSELMDKVVLTSERSLSDCSSFAVGIIQDDELHITPLHAMLRMRLQCDYLDESDKRTKDGAKGTGEGKK